MIPTADVRVHPQADVPIMAIASLMLVIVALVAGIACSNLATLLLIRGAARAKEVSVRLAMGATRSQLVRHLLVESLLLSLAGGTAGSILAWWTTRALQRAELPVTIDLTMDFRVLAFAIGLSLVTGVVFNLAPALKATRLDLVTTLRDEGVPPLDRRGLTLKNALVVVQVAVSVLLLGVTSIFLQQAAANAALRGGYAVGGVAMIETDVSFSSYRSSAAADVNGEILRRIAAVPGVQSAALIPNHLPAASAERHADPDLARPPRHRKCDDRDQRPSHWREPRVRRAGSSAKREPAAQHAQRGRATAEISGGTRSETASSSAQAISSRGSIRSSMLERWTEQVPQLRGRLTTIREVAASDVYPLFTLFSDPAVTAYMAPPPPTLAKFAGFVQWSHEQREQGHGLCLGIVPDGMTSAIGILQVRALDSTLSNAQWGFVLSAHFWATGVFVDAANALLEFAFTTLHVERLEARIAQPADLHLSGRRIRRAQQRDDGAR